MNLPVPSLVSSAAENTAEVYTYTLYLQVAGLYHLYLYLYFVSSAAENKAEGVVQPGLYGLYDGSGFTLDITNLTTSYLVESFNFLYAAIQHRQVRKSLS